MELLGVLATVLLLSCVGIASCDGESVPRTCLCDSSDRVDFQQHRCSESPFCNDTNSLPLPLIGCLVAVARHPSSRIQEPLIVQNCVRGLFDYSNYCTPASEQERQERRVVTMASDIIRICCFERNCNTLALLNSTIESRGLQDDISNFYKTLPPSTPSPPTTAIPSTQPAPLPTTAPLYAIITISALSIIVVVTVTIIIVGVCYHHRRRLFVHHVVQIECKSPGISPHTIVCPELSHDDTENSGSGSGKPLLVHRSIAGQINLHELIGKGRYGRVFKASYRLDDVAVKVFHTVEKASWAHEVDIYQTCLFCHPNILRFVASDSRDCGSQVELWLITEYCEFGSLYDVLSQNTFSPENMLQLAYTAVSGLDHLHTVIFGLEAKPAIVHRDLKSRNILVKRDYTCCIGDLGLALRYDRKKEQAEDPPSKKVGTKRYLAPEIIDDSISLKHFELFKRADIYSFGLILWEIVMRGEIDDEAEDYLMPYQNMVPTDPSFEDMKKVVVVEKKRPPLPNRWNQSEVFRSMSKLVQQCWLHDSDARPTSQRLKRNINNLQQALITDKKDGEHSTGK